MKKDWIVLEIEWFVNNKVGDLVVFDFIFNIINGYMVLDLLECIGFLGKISF